MAWFFYALATSLCWGLGYVSAQRLLHEGVSPSVVMLIITALSAPAYLAVILYKGGLSASLQIILAERGMIIWALLAGLTFVFGNLFIMTSVQMKNAALANIIEITYPVFTILFTWLILKEFHLNWSAALGTFLILSGVTLILTEVSLKNP